MLAGGASRRMGSDKALVEVDGIAMAARVAAAMQGAGASRVVLVGGDPSRARRLGLGHVPDRHPGAGPLAGLASALAGLSETEPATTDGRIVLVAGCDQPWLDAETLGALVAALEASPSAVASVGSVGSVESGRGGRGQPLPAAWRAGAAAPLEVLVATGERRLGAATSVGPVVEVPVRSSVVADVDRPGDLVRPEGRPRPDRPEP